jgi:hypothetical protein
MYYSPEIVKLLMDERVREAQSLRHATLPHESRAAAWIHRLFVRTPAPVATSCTACAG